MTTTIYWGDSWGPTVLHRGQVIIQSRGHSFWLCLTFYNLNRNRHSLNLGDNILYHCRITENNMDDDRQGKETRAYKCKIHRLYTESNNMGFTYQNPFFHFYWHSPTVYKKYYTRVVHIVKQNKKIKTIHKNQYLSTKNIKRKRNNTYKSALLMLIKQHKIAIKR